MRNCMVTMLGVVVACRLALKGYVSAGGPAVGEDDVFRLMCRSSAYTTVGVCLILVAVFNRYHACASWSCDVNGGTKQKQF